tara:strand:+ start:29384 stop:29602 length:219 start_codon:yes stop_codon:yes gene_type:complete
MSLNKANLKTALIALFTAEQDEEENANQSIERLATGISDAVEAFVKSGTVNVNVTTTGTATNHTGGGTGNIT